MNQTLLGKWLWRIDADQDSLWHFILAKYGAARNGWDIKDPNYRTRGLWSFKANIKFKVRSGDKILFWLDTWVRDCSLATCFLDLLSCASKPKAKTSTYMMKNGDQVHRGPIFKKNLADRGKSVFLLFIFLAKYPPKVWVLIQDFGPLPRMVSFRLLPSLWPFF